MRQRWFFAIATRRGLLLAIVCCGLLLLNFLSCRLSFNASHRPTSTRINKPLNEPEYQALLQELEEPYQHYVSSLAKQIGQLKEALAHRSTQLQMSLGNLATEFFPDTGGNALPGEKTNLQEFLQSQLKRAEVHSGNPVAGEYNLVPFESFTLHKVGNSCYY